MSSSSSSNVFHSSTQSFVTPESSRHEVAQTVAQQQQHSASIQPISTAPVEPTSWQFVKLFAQRFWQVGTVCKTELTINAVGLCLSIALPSSVYANVRSLLQAPIEPIKLVKAHVPSSAARFKVSRF
jgi:hypothetical protein